MAYDAGLGASEWEAFVSMAEERIAAERPAARDVLGHKPQSVLFDGEAWNITCECQWETNGRGAAWQAWSDFGDHVTDDVRTVLDRIERETKVVYL